MNPPQKTLPVGTPYAAETFLVQERPAFLILPVDAAKQSRPIPWVWYAPTLPGLPGEEERWMFERFLAAGIAVAGIDVGESYGSPAGRALFSGLYEELTGRRKLAPRAALLARSRGGLMLGNWASENPSRVAAIAGIYPVCDLRSYPGLAKACGAYGLTEEQLKARLAEHNPVERLAPLAKARVPIFLLHGDQDTVVPLDPNSGEVARKYAKLGGEVILRIMPYRGHDMWPGWFQSEELTDFLIRHGKAANEK